MSFTEYCEKIHHDNNVHKFHNYELFIKVTNIMQVEYL